jgi:hypothetical protein
MFVLGCLYNFCTYHHSLRVAFYVPKGRRRWLHRTLAIAAGLTDHRQRIAKLCDFRAPPPPGTPPKRRGRPAQRSLQLVEQWVM